MSKEDALKELYYDLEPGYGSIRNLSEQAKQKSLVTTLEEIQEWVEKNSTNKEGIIKLQTNIHRCLPESTRAV